MGYGGCEPRIEGIVQWGGFFLLGGGVGRGQGWV